MKTHEIITGLRKLSQQGSPYRRTVCRLAAGLLESQQRRITELKNELRSAVYDLGVASECWSCKHDSKCHSDMPIAMPDACCGSYKWRGATDTNVGGKWIAVTERLPESECLVLTIVSGQHRNITFDKAYELAEYCSEGWVLATWPEWENPNVTYWMPLPEPPKEGTV